MENRLNGYHPQHPKEETDKMIQKLRTQLIELKDQNEELRKKQLELIQERNKYTALYDSAPIGCITFNEDGLILDTNLAFSGLCGLEKSKLINQPFSCLIASDSQDDFHIFINEILKSHNHHIVQLKLKRSNGSTFFAQLENDLETDDVEGQSLIRAFVIDITEQKRIEGQLQFHAQLLDTVEQAVIVTDKNGSVVFWNTFAEDLYGWPAEEAKGKNIYELIAIKENVRLSEELKKTVQSGKAWNREHIGRHRSGKKVFVHTSITPIMNSDGSLSHTISVTADISDRKKNEEALWQGKQRYEELVQTANVIILKMDINGNTTFFNQYAQDFFGFNESEVIGKPAVGTYVPETESFGRNLASIISGVLGNPNQYKIHENENIKKSGERVWISWSNKAIRDSGGNVIEILSIGQDLTMTRQLKMELTDSQRRLQIAMKSAKMVHLEYNLLTSELHFSDDLFHILEIDQLRAELTRESLFEFVHPDDLDRVIKTYRVSILTKKPYELQHRIRVKSGRIKYIKVSGSTDYNDDGIPTRVMLLGKDITRQIEAEELIRKARMQAELANQAKSTFLANMSHELRTPLNSILGFSQLILRDSSLSQKARNNLETIVRSGDHLLALINDVLEMSKIEVGKLELQLERVDFKEVIRIVKLIIQPLADQKNLKFDIIPAPNLPKTILADESKLRQILVNLLSNAIKFTDFGGVSMRVSCSEDESTDSENALIIQFLVEDTGIGMSTETLDNLFQPFFQVNRPGATTEGTGLGLSISKKFVDLLGGTITVESQEGKGSAFTVRFPVATCDADLDIPEQNTDLFAEPDSAEFINQRLLLVDDNPVHLEVLSAFLEDDRIEIETAVNGKDAIQKALIFKPHLMFIDIRMPEMNGYETIRTIKANNQIKHIPAVAVTADAFEEDRTTILTAGFDDFIRKPVQGKNVDRVITRFLGIKRIDQEVADNSIEPYITDNLPLRPDDLLKIPRYILLELEQSSLKLNAQKVSQAIDKIGSINEEIANQLSILANNFKFDEIYHLARQAK